MVEMQGLRQRHPVDTDRKPDGDADHTPLHHVAAHGRRRQQGLGQIGEAHLAKMLGDAGIRPGNPMMFHGNMVASEHGRDGKQQRKAKGTAGIDAAMNPAAVTKCRP